MFGKRFLNNKQHRVNSESKTNNNNNFLNKNRNLNEEIKFNEENETDLNPRIENKTEINIKDKVENKEKKKSVIVNKAGNFLSFSSGITLEEDNEKEKRGIYDINSSTGNFLKDNFSSQKDYEKGIKKNNDIEHFFAPLTQEDLDKINTENYNNNKNKISGKKLIQNKLNIDKFNQSNQDIINKYSKQNQKSKNLDELEFDIENDDDAYGIDDESSEGFQKIPKNKMKLINKLGIDLEDETNLNKDIDNIIKDKVDRIKEVKQHQRQCLLTENLDGLYGKSQNPDDIIKGIYDTLNDENNDSEYEEEIDKWEKAQFKSGIKLNQLNLNNESNIVNNNNEINNNFKYNNLYAKLNKKEGIEFDDIIDNMRQIIERDKSLLYNFVNKKNDYNIELRKIISNQKKLESDITNYIHQYNEFKKFLINITNENKDKDIDDIDLDSFYVSD